MTSPNPRRDTFPKALKVMPAHGPLRHPFSEIKILLLESISSNAKDELVKQGFKVKEIARGLEGDELKKELADVHVVGIRSKTHITAEMIQAAPKLLCIGAFCIGTNQIDLEAAQKRGIPVFNSPFQNSRSVAELIISNIIALARRLGDRNMEMHSGKWNKTSKESYEVRGKVLGIVGYGHVGSQLAVLAEAIGLDVRYYDTQMVMPLGNSTKLQSLDELLQTADFVTLHVPLTSETEKMIGEREVNLMKKGSYLLNASRGTVVQIPAVAAALKSGHLAGAYFDVFPEEPASNGDGFVTELQGCPNVLLSPHIGGSTLEAQVAIAEEVSARFIAYLTNGHTTGAVNFPELELPFSRQTHRILNLHENKPGVLKAINNILSVYNVSAQMLRTMGHIGYLIADVDQEASGEIKRQISELPTSIRTRILY